jgi:hypothetical protein
MASFVLVSITEHGVDVDRELARVDGGARWRLASPGTVAGRTLEGGRGACMCDTNLSNE